MAWAFPVSRRSWASTGGSATSDGSFYQPFRELRSRALGPTSPRKRGWDAQRDSMDLDGGTPGGRLRRWGGGGRAGGNGGGRRQRRLPAARRVGARARHEQGR